MLICCFEFNDLSPVLPLTAADVPLLELLTHRKLERENSLAMCQADIRFFLQRLADGFTGSAPEFIPSSIAKMEKRLEKIENAGI